MPPAYQLERLAVHRDGQQQVHGEDAGRERHQAEARRRPRRRSCRRRAASGPRAAGSGCARIGCSAKSRTKAGPDQPGAAQQRAQQEEHEEEEERRRGSSRAGSRAPSPATQRPPSRYSVVAELRRGAPGAWISRTNTSKMRAHSRPSSDARQQVASDERVAQAPREQPAPRDDGLRPVLADVGLERRGRAARRRPPRRASCAIAASSRPNSSMAAKWWAAAGPERHVQAEDDVRPAGRAPRRSPRPLT